MGEIKAVVFDFGGVIAEEGFREGLKAIARSCGLDENRFFAKARKIVYDCGYTSGKATEAEYWRRIREETGVELTDREMREEIMKRFVLRPEVLDYAASIMARGIKTAILTDQTNWIEEINARKHFYGNFDFVFNSYRINKTKKDPSIFIDMCRMMGVSPSETLFIDDDTGHVERASSQGLKTIHYSDFESFKTLAETLVRSRGL